MKRRHRTEAAWVVFTVLALFYFGYEVGRAAVRSLFEHTPDRWGR